MTRTNKTSKAFKSTAYKSTSASYHKKVMVMQDIMLKKCTKLMRGFRQDYINEYTDPHYVQKRLTLYNDVIDSLQRTMSLMTNNWNILSDTDKTSYRTLKTVMSKKMQEKKAFARMYENEIITE